MIVVTVLWGRVVFKELIFKFVLWKGVVVLKELIFSSFYFWGGCSGL